MDPSPPTSACSLFLSFLQIFFLSKKTDFSLPLPPALLQLSPLKKPAPLLSLSSQLSIFFPPVPFSCHFFLKPLSLQLPSCPFSLSRSGRLAPALLFPPQHHVQSQPPPWLQSSPQPRASCMEFFRSWSPTPNVFFRVFPKVAGKTKKINAYIYIKNKSEKGVYNSTMKTISKSTALFVTFKNVS